ncbi:hypothetical protein DFS34DRAFT_597194 [Phlyctochytrium arcticum]|nr:hypothetical protein DFS34DRAFT_597194 [Phlyctochytrium arcticum]
MNFPQSMIKSGLSRPHTPRSIARSTETNWFSQLDPFEGFGVACLAVAVAVDNAKEAATGAWGLYQIRLPRNFVSFTMFLNVYAIKSEIMASMFLIVCEGKPSSPPPGADNTTGSIAPGIRSLRLCGNR